MPAVDAIARRLGSPAVRRRRHRRVAIGAAILLVIAIALVLVGTNGDDDFEDEAGAVCDDYVARIQNEYRLSFPEGVPTAAAFAEYLAHAFADTMDDLVADLRALDPPVAVQEIVDQYAAVVADVRARPDDFVTESPFADAAAAMDGAGVAGCGGEFFTAIGPQ